MQVTGLTQVVTWNSASVHPAAWTRAGIVAALSRGPALVVGGVDQEVSLVVAAFGHDVAGAVKSDAASTALSAAAMELGLACRYTTTGDGELPFPDGAFGTVIVTEIPDAGRLTATLRAEARRVCRAGGRLIASVPNVDHPAGRKRHDRRSREALAEFLGGAPADRIYWPDGPARWLLGWIRVPGRGQPLEATGDVGRLVTPPPASPDDAELVTVIVPTFNRAPLLRRALDAIQAQRYRNLEIIVVDDGSTDGTEAVVARHPAKPAYLRKPNGGKSSALNAALPLARGRFVWIADDDDLALPFKVTQQARILCAHPDAALVYSGCYYFSGAPRRLSGYLPPREFAPGCQMSSLLEFKLGTGVTGLYRTDALRAVGPFDERLTRSQDLDMWIRLARGFSFRWLPFPTLLYRTHRGWRGSARDRFPPEQNEARWLEFDRQIYHRAYWSLGLAEIDPRVGDGADPVRNAAALILRARIMLRQRHVDYACRDLREAVHELGRDGGGSAEGLLPSLFELDRVAMEVGSRPAWRAADRAFRAVQRRDAGAFRAVARYMARQVAQVPGPHRLRYLGRLLRFVTARGILGRG